MGEGSLESIAVQSYRNHRQLYLRGRQTKTCSTNPCCSASQDTVSLCRFSLATRELSCHQFSAKLLLWALLSIQGLRHRRGRDLWHDEGWESRCDPTKQAYRFCAHTLFCS